MKAGVPPLTVAPAEGNVTLAQFLFTGVQTLGSDRIAVISGQPGRPVLSPCSAALVFGLISAAGLPLGAILGSSMTEPMTIDDLRIQASVQKIRQRDQIIACVLAFGAGSLLFAVTVELYSEAMDRLSHHGYHQGIAEIVVSIICCCIGSLFYIFSNRWMEAHLNCPGEIEPGEATPLLMPKENAGFRARSAAVQELAEGFEEDASEQEQVEELASGNSQPASGNSQPRSPGPTAANDLADEEWRLQRKNHREHSVIVGAATWLGVFIDGLPDGVFLGILASKRKLSAALVVSLFIVNVPDAFASASILREGRTRESIIVMLWSGLFVITGVVAATTCSLVGSGHSSPVQELFVAAFEGLAGGAMLSCITGAMIVEAHDKVRDMVGFIAACGFIFSISLKVFAGDVA